MRNYINEELSVSISGIGGKCQAIVKYNYNGDLGHISEYDDDGKMIFIRCGKIISQHVYTLNTKCLI